MIKAVLIAKGKEPMVVEVEKSLDSYYKMIEGNLTDNERLLNPTVTGVDFFGVGLKNVSGMVDDYSACHPYERNRTWHGPALFTQYNDEGETVSMSDENIEELINMFSLSNELKSPSDFINQFVKKYSVAEVYSFDYEGNFAVMNTMDAVDLILREQDEDAIVDIEEIFENMITIANNNDFVIKKIFTDYLKEVNKYNFIEQVKSLNFFE